MTTKSELLTCPFCGNANLSTYKYPSSSMIPEQQWHSVRCGNCQVAIDRDSESEVITAWNTRAVAARMGAEPVAWISTRFDGEQFFGKRPIPSMQAGFYSHTPLYTHPSPVEVTNANEVRQLVKSNEREFMLVLANRIVGNAPPEDDARLAVAYAIARYLELGWPAAQLAECAQCDAVIESAAVLRNAAYSVLPRPYPISLNNPDTAAANWEREYMIGNTHIKVPVEALTRLELALNALPEQVELRGVQLARAALGSKP